MTTIVSIPEIRAALEASGRVAIGPFVLAVSTVYDRWEVRITPEHGAKRALSCQHWTTRERAIDEACGATVATVWHQQAVLDGPIDRAQLPGLWEEHGPDADPMLVYSDARVSASWPGIVDGVHVSVRPFPVHARAGLPRIVIEAQCSRPDRDRRQYNLVAHVDTFAAARHVALCYLRRAYAFLAQPEQSVAA